MKAYENPEERSQRAGIVEVPSAREAWPKPANNNQAERPNRTKAERARREGWRAACIVDDKGRIVANLANAMIALRTDPSLESAFTFDAMAQAAKLMKRLPVAPSGKPAGLDPVPRPVRDEDVSQLQEWLQHQGLPRIWTGDRPSSRRSAGARVFLPPGARLARWP
jgi:hypothetical protein